MGLEYSNIKKIVRFRFKDYYDIERIEELTKKYYDIIRKTKEKDFEIESDVTISLLIDHYIYNELLKSTKAEDQEYILNLCKTTLNHIINTRERIDKGYAYVKSEDEVLEYCKNNYDGSISFVHFMTEFALGYYNGKDQAISEKERQDYLEQERIYLESLKNMYSYEKKLNFKH